MKNYSGKKAPISVQKNYKSFQKNTIQREQRKLKKIMIKDLNQFPQVQAVLQHFPGEVYEEYES